jgi:hypothetical protein
MTAAVKFTFTEAKVLRKVVERGIEMSVDDLGRPDGPYSSPVYSYPLGLSAAEWDRTVDKILAVVRNAEIGGVPF